MAHGHLHLVILIVAFIARTQKVPNKHFSCNQVKLTETVLENVASNVRIIFFVPEEVVFLQIGGQVYRSRDGGISWSEETINSRMPHSEDFSQPVFYMLQHELNSEASTLYFVGNQNGHLWITTDAGESYKFYHTLSGATYLMPHPLSTGIMLILKPDSLGGQLWLSYDGASTWRLILNDVYYTWVAWSNLVNSPTYRIFALRRINVDVGGQLVYSDDYFVTEHVITFQTDSSANSTVVAWYLLPPDYMLVVTCEEESCVERMLFLSSDSGNHWNRVKLPREQQNDAGFSSIILRQFDGHNFFVEANQVNSTSGFNLYHGPSDAHILSLVLPRIVNSELVKNYGTDGFYFATHSLNGASVTLISFNEGSTWQLLQAPHLNEEGQPTNCSTDRHCSLHLHGLDTYLNFPYSTTDAPGITLSNGNLGSALNVHDSTTFVYYSRNGGVSWNEVASGPHHFEISDHGAIVLLIPIAESNALIYSVDEGDTWVKCNYSTEPLILDNVRVSGGVTSRRFIAYGRRRNSTGGFNTVLIHLNFDVAFAGPCNDAGGDYELWSPTDPNGIFLLGAQRTVKRRRAGRQCYISEEYLPVTLQSRSPCTAEDYECDYCFTRPNLTSPCTLHCLIPDLPPDPVNCPKGSYWESDLGYHLVDGDLCDPSLLGAGQPRSRVPCGMRSTPEISPSEFSSEVTSSSQHSPEEISSALPPISLVPSGKEEVSPTVDTPTNPPTSEESPSTFSWPSAFPPSEDGYLSSAASPSTLAPSFLLSPFASSSTLDSSPSRLISTVLILVAVILLCVFALVGVALYLWRYNDSFYNLIRQKTGLENCFGRSSALRYEAVANDVDLGFEDEN